jgi:hypothetical protein
MLHLVHFQTPAKLISIYICSHAARFIVALKWIKILNMLHTRLRIITAHVTFFSVITLLIMEASLPPDKGTVIEEV